MYDIKIYYPFWIGYFETLHRGEIVDDELSFET
jgi:hypothetical protein